MRDLLDDMFSNQPLDPNEAARRTMRPQLRRRFYERAVVEEGAEGGKPEFRIVLDGRPVKTPARRTLAAPARALAEAIAAEWEAQRDVVDPSKMPLTRLASISAAWPMLRRGGGMEKYLTPISCSAVPKARRRWRVRPWPGTVLAWAQSQGAPCWCRAWSCRAARAVLEAANAAIPPDH